MNRAANRLRSSASDRRPLARIDLRKLGATALMTLGALLLAFGAYQGVIGHRYAQGQEKVEQGAQAFARQLSAELDRERAQIEAIAADPRLLTVVGRDGAAATLEVLRAENPAIDRLLLLPPAVESLKPQPYPGPDFAAIAAALRVKSSPGEVRPLVSGAASEIRLTWAAPVSGGQAPKPVAYLVASWRLAPLLGDLARLAGPGYLDVRYARSSGAYDVIVSRGQLGAGYEPAGSLPAREPLRVGYLMPRPFLVIVESFVGVLLIGLSGVALIAGGVTLRRGTAWLDRLRGSDLESLEADRDRRDAEDGASSLVDEELEEAMDFTAGAKESVARASKSTLSRQIFRAYDIRGIVGRTLDRDIAALIGQAIGSEARSRGCEQIVVARDGRLSSAELAEGLVSGLTAAGMDVTDIGAAPTGVLYFATHHLQTGSGVMVTGSHNPPEYNGFKIVLGGETLAGDAIGDLYRRITEEDFVTGEGGVQELDIREDYVDRIASDIQVEEPLRVVVDCGNGIAGILAPQVIEEIGCEVVPLYCEVDGRFPNHHPDPSDPVNLQDVILTVKQLDADLGLALDGDGDRLGVVMKSGRVVYPDRILMLFAEDVLLRNPGATVIYDVKCTGHLAKVILSNGGSPLMWKTGHSLIKRKMKETDAALAGEMSGHFFFQERWYGFDDGIYAAARLLEILASSPGGAEETLAELPDSVSTPELKIDMAEGGEHFAFMTEFAKKASFPDARITTIDGIRADYDDGWGLVRPSNTTPSLVLRFDAESQAALARIQEAFRAELLKIRQDLAIPF